MKQSNISEEGRVYCYIKVPEITNGQYLGKWRLARAYENESGYYPYGKQNKDDPLEFDSLSEHLTKLPLLLIVGMIELVLPKKEPLR